MKLIRIGSEGEEKPVVLHSDGTMRDISGLVGDLSGNSLSLETMDAIRNSDLDHLPVVAEGGRIAGCLADVPNFHCVGLNYVNHAKETGAKIPEEPILFWKATSALSGPFDPITVLPDRAWRALGQGKVGPGLRTCRTTTRHERRSRGCDELASHNQGEWRNPSGLQYIGYDLFGAIHYQLHEPVHEVAGW